MNDFSTRMGEIESRSQEIAVRMSAIASEAEADDADLDVLKGELNALKEERSSLEHETAQIKEKLEARTQLLADIADGKATVETREKAPERRTPMDFSTMKPAELGASPEYRTAWLNKMRGVSLSEPEERAFTGSAYVIPDVTANKIIDALVDMVPLLNEVDLMRIKGNVSVAVQSAVPSPTLAAGGGELSEATTTLAQVTLGSYTMSTLVRIGADTASMAIDAFEGWLTGKIAEQLSYKLEYYIIKGTGDSQPKGIDAISWVDNTNAIDWASTALADDDIDQAIGLLPAVYDRNSKFLMSKKTFFTNVIGLTDTNNVPLVAREGGKYLLRGYPVLFSDQCDAGDIFFGDFKRGMVANLSSDIQIERARNLVYNAYDYLGWCAFDCEPTGINCIVKIAADIT